jgi:hypothetical protein
MYHIFIANKNTWFHCSCLDAAQIYLRIRPKVLEADGVPFGRYPCSQKDGWIHAHIDTFCSSITVFEAVWVQYCIKGL